MPLSWPPFPPAVQRELGIENPLFSFVLTENCSPQRPPADFLEDDMGGGGVSREASRGSQKLLGSLATPCDFWTAHIHPSFGRSAFLSSSLLGSSITTENPACLLTLPCCPQLCQSHIPPLLLLRNRCGFGSTCWKKGATPFNPAKKEFQDLSLTMTFAIDLWNINISIGPTMCHTLALRIEW